MQPLDAFGEPLSVGDKVIFMQIGYRCFVAGTIVSLSPQSAVIDHPRLNDRSGPSRQRYDQIIIDHRK